MPVVVAAGKIRGILTRGEQPISGVKINITLGSKTYSSMTDKYGSYRVFVPGHGQCLSTSQ